MMKKESVLLCGSTLITLTLSLAIVKWQAPGLLGLPSDLELVQIDKIVPPFYSGVFRNDGTESNQFIVADPITRVRARPFFPESVSTGPHDLLGFRNRAVPAVVDIIAIGDSQTYGNNATLEDNWPSQLGNLLHGKQNRVYAMATGGWGAVQYLDMFSNALRFRPKVAVVAFYSGNDSLESFQMAYGNPNWSQLILNSELDKANVPKVTFPAPESEWWRVQFNDGVRTIFAPTLRLACNRDHAAVTAGYAIMAEVARQIAATAVKQEIQAVFTIIPTKELVYAKKVARQGLAAPEDYQQLVASELSRINHLREEIQSISGAVYIDVLGPLQEAAMTGLPLYPEDINGHPVAAGYGAIAATVAKTVAGFVNPISRGLYGVPIGGDKFNIALVNDQGGWFFNSLDIIEKNGWPEQQVPILSSRDFASLPFKGVIDEVDPQRFGP